MLVTVILSSALLCIGNDCYPALIGEKTPVGEFKLIQRLVSDPLYKGSVLQYSETKSTVLAIHRPWRGKPEQKRDELLKNSNSNQRTITNGCINVTDEIYEKLLDCCSNSKLFIVDSLR